MLHGQDNRKARRGAVLIIALIVLSSVIISSVGLGMLIINSLQQTRTLDQATVAFYAAETAVEKAIWQVRRSGEFDAPLPPPVPAESEVSQLNGAAWHRDISGEEEDIRLAIPRNTFFELDLFEPTNTLGQIDPLMFENQIDHLTIDWQQPDDCAVLKNCPVLFAEWVRWYPQDLDVDPTEADTPGIMVFSKRYRKDLLDPEPARIPPVGEVAPDGSPAFPASLSIPTYAYRLRLRAEYADMRQVVITAKDSNDNRVDIPGRVKIDAWGRYGDTYQKLSVRVPRKTPLSSLFDFAIFSECSLVKGYIINCNEQPVTP